MKLPAILARGVLEYSRRAPEHRGLDRLRRWTGRLCHAPVVRTPMGFRLRIRVEDTMARSYVGDWMHPLLETALGGVPAGGRVLDIGANVGAFAILASTRVGPGGLVLAVEPSPSNYAELLYNLSLQASHCVVPIHAAVADRPALLELHEAAGHTGVTSLRPIAGVGVSGVVRVPVVDGRILGELAGPAPIDLLKLDVEGAEVLVLRGLGELLRRTRAALVEVTPRYLEAFGCGRPELLDLLAAAGLRPSAPLTNAWQEDVLFRRA